MANTDHGAGADFALAGGVAAATGESVFACYQCGKCTAGCPLADDMDVAPHEILRLLQYTSPKFDDEAVRSLSIWLCLTCETCATRCPQEVDLPRIMEYLRQESLQRGMAHADAADIAAFHRSFLNTVRRGGRLHEVGLVAEYKLRTGHFLQDVLLTPRLFRRGKLSVLPHGVTDKPAVRRIFERCEAAERHSAERAAVERVGAREAHADGNGRAAPSASETRESAPQSSQGGRS